jgi:hypothetical protein
MNLEPREQPFGALIDLVSRADVGSEGEAIPNQRKSAAHNGSVSFEDQPTHLEMRLRQLARSDCERVPVTYKWDRSD